MLTIKKKRLDLIRSKSINLENSAQQRKRNDRIPFFMTHVQT